MSIKGTIEARCPNGCEPVTIEVWSFVRGDQDEALRLSLLAGELNLVLCEHCSRAFYPEATVVYLDSAAELLAFVFPESYREEEERWRGKMRADFLEMKAVLLGELEFCAEPLLFFGFDGIRALLELEDDLRDEVEIAGLLAGQAGLKLAQLDRRFAREKGLPWTAPHTGASFSTKSAAEGLRALLARNDRLEGYKKLLGVVLSGTVPPFRRGPGGKR